MIVSKEQAEKIIELVKDYASSGAEMTSQFLAEVINFYLFKSVLSIVSALGIFLITYVIIKILNSFAEAEDKKETKHFFLGLKKLAVIVSLVTFWFVSYPSVEKVGKILISPSLFLGEEAIHLVKELKK
jgi:uncharacterized protein YggT (Ycf19 family)